MIRVLLLVTMLPAVNVKNANFYLPYSDFPHVDRSYNSRSLHNGGIGFGWTYGFDTQIKFEDDGQVHLVDGDGYILHFDPAETLKQNASLWAEIEKNQPEVEEQADEKRYYSTERGVEVIQVVPGQITRTLPDGSVQIFDSTSRRMTKWTKADRFVTFRYGEKNIAELEDSKGFKVTFTTGSNGKISEATSSEGKTIKYEYVGDDLVKVVKHNGDVVAHEYDKYHNMTKIVLPGDDGAVAIDYDVKKDWVVAQLGPGDKKTTYEYGGTVASGSYWTLVTDATGTTKFAYDDKKHTLTVTEPSGRIVEKEFGLCCGRPVQVRITEPGSDPPNGEMSGNGGTTKKEEPTDWIGTDRPTAGEASTTVGSGTLQVELGVDYERSTDDLVTLDNFRTPIEVRYGLTDNVEFHIQTAGYSVDNVDIANGGSSRSAGFSDLEAGFKAHIANIASHSLGVSVTFTGPTGSKTFRSDTITPTAKVLADFSIPGGIGVGLNLGASLVSGGADGTRSDVPVLYTLAVGRSFGTVKPITVFGEVYGVIPTDGRNDPTQIADVGALYPLSRNLQVDAAVRFGLGASPDFGATVGLSVRN